MRSHIRIPRDAGQRFRPNEWWLLPGALVLILLVSMAFGERFGASATTAASEPQSSDFVHIHMP